MARVVKWTVTGTQDVFTVEVTQRGGAGALIEVTKGDEGDSRLYSEVPLSTAGDIAAGTAQHRAVHRGRTIVDALIFALPDSTLTEEY